MFFPRAPFLQLALALLVLCVGADHTNDAFSANNFAVAAHPLN
jgi:hypothetical protein